MPMAGNATKDSTASDRFILGIDGGGSKTAVQVVTPAGELRGQGLRGASNYQAVGLEAALSALNGAVNDALAEAGIDARRIEAVCLGLAGVDRPEDQAIFQRWLNETIPDAPSIIANDAHLVLAAGTPDGWGISLICGTGAICIGRDRAGTLTRVDGWGHVLGDHGSGYAIGRRALQAAMEAYDGRGAETRLLPAILSHCGLEEPENLIAWVYQRPASTTDIAALARLVEEAAAQGDSAAAHILSAAGFSLALTVATAARRLGFEGAFPCALAGGVITRGDHVRAAFLDGAEERGLQLDPVTRVFDPVTGAVRLAQRLAASVR